MVLKLILRDAVFWMVIALVTVLVGGAALIKNDRPGSEGSAPLAGAASIPSAADDPVVYAIVNGTFPKVDSQLTLGQAFARYRWFSGQPKWIGRGQPSSRTVLVSVPLKLPAEAVELGVGSGAAMIFYAAEFGLSGDSKSFRPISSAVEVRDGSNKLIARVPDPEFILVRRVMRDVEPGVSLRGGVAKGR